MQSKKINQLATELVPDLTDITIIGDPITGISKKITLSQMASLFTGTVEEYASLSAFPLVGTGDTIYIALDTNIIYRWNTGTSSYNELSPNIVTSLIFNDANGFDGTISLVGSTATLSITTALTLGSVPFIGTSGALSQDNANHFWDNTNKRLGINTNAPTTALDVFGSGIIGRINGTSTNNAFLGFASAGTNKWSIGNVQSDHRFRIYSEANSTELVSVLQTGEFGIGIANPLTKLHIDGGASALIANLDANVSVAKSISFRSDNSARINLEVSGTESGSNAGADLFIKTFSDAGASLNSNAFFIKRSSGFIGINTNNPNDFLEVRGSARLSGGVSIAPQFSIFSNNQTNNNISLAQGFATTTDNIGYLYNRANADFVFGTNNIERVRILANGNVGIGNSTPNSPLHIQSSTVGLLMFLESNQSNTQIRFVNTSTSGRTYSIGSGGSISGAINGFYIYDETATTTRLGINASGQIGIGTTTHNTQLHVVNSNDGRTAGFSGTAYGLRIDNGGSFGFGGSTIHGVDNTLTGSYQILGLNGSQIIFGTSYNERMRLNSSGQFLIGQTTPSGATNGIYFRPGVESGIIVTSDIALQLSRLGSTGDIQSFYSGSTRVGTISVSSTNTSYNTSSSDLKLKKNFEDWNENVLNSFKNINPKLFNFNFEEDGSPLTKGFIAQEMVDKFPEAYPINEKGFYSFNPSGIVVYLMKAIQELYTKIDAK